jgi:diguanylate cyclase (GGDEF)-like protein
VNILIAEDDLVSRHRLETLLRTWGYCVSIAADGAEALRLLEQPDHPRLAVLDRGMPHMDGLDVCRAIRGSGSEPYVYIILLTYHDRQEDLIEGFAAGADDYVVKPFEVQELKARVQTGARIVELHEQLIAAREQVKVESMHDSLTRALNRVAFFETFEREVARARRKGGSLALIMADIDHFKAINDRHGHLAGDAVLREAARRLKVSLRASDAIGRYGGEEFVILAPDCALDPAVSLAERCCEAVALEPIQMPSGCVTVTMSVGVAATDDMNEAERLLHTADEALYKAKQSGRNRVAAGSLTVAPR